MSQTEEFDFVVYGATGFTGKLVARYLDSHIELKGKPWAIDGRNQNKLKMESSCSSE